MDRPVHLEVGHGHDDGMYEVRAVREPAERLEQVARQRGVDKAAVTGATGDHDPGERGTPGGMADGRVQRRTGQVQMDHVQAVHQVGQTE